MLTKEYLDALTILYHYVGIKEKDLFNTNDESRI